MDLDMGHIKIHPGKVDLDMGDFKIHLDFARGASRSTQMGEPREVSCGFPVLLLFSFRVSRTCEPLRRHDFRDTLQC